MLNKSLPISLLAVSLCLTLPACGGDKNDDDDNHSGGLVGKTDAGSTSTDAGSHGMDAGTQGQDAGDTSPDAGDAPDCGSVTAQGECSGNTLKICRGGSLVSEECAPYACGYDAKKKTYACTDDCFEECGSIGESGKCSGNTLKYCSPYSQCLVTEDCGSKTCSYISDREQYECAK